MGVAGNKMDEPLLDQPRGELLHVRPKTAKRLPPVTLKQAAVADPGGQVPALRESLGFARGGRGSP